MQRLIRISDQITSVMNRSSDTPGGLNRDMTQIGEKECQNIFK
jgi:hypothetical protein